MVIHQPFKQVRFLLLSSLEVGLTTVGDLIKATAFNNSLICGDRIVRGQLHSFESLKLIEVQQSMYQSALSAQQYL